MTFMSSPYTENGVRFHPDKWSFLQLILAPIVGLPVKVTVRS